MLVGAQTLDIGLVCSIEFIVARGFTRSGQGNPDEARAARYILKDYVNAKLLYCHPPPDYPSDSFNDVTHQNSLRRYANKKSAPTTRVGKGADTYIASPTDSTPGDSISGIGQSRRSKAIDKDFFYNGHSLSARPFVQGSARNGMEYSRSQLFPHQNAVANDGTPINGKFARVASVMASAGGDAPSGKKHHKKIKRVKQRSGKGYDD
jgi:large subunit GTPase 1